MSRLVSTESNVQASVIEWLNLVPGVKAWRQNTGAQLLEYTSKKTKQTKRRMVRFGQPGQGDVGGIVRPHGIRLEIEVKKPGESPSMDQELWMKFIQDCGGISFWCDSLRSCVVQLADEFKRRGWAWSESWEVW